MAPMQVSVALETGALCVVSSHPAASRIAADILGAGGSLADAAIAGGAVLTVVSQPATSLAGDAIMLVHEAASGRTVCLNATGRAPVAFDPACFADGIHWRGGHTVTSPGLVRGWEALHQRFGRLDWANLFEPALRMAADGAAISAKMAHDIRHYRETLEKDAGASALFLPEGNPLEEGAVQRQPALARSLEEVMVGGADAFYAGRIPRAIAAAVQAAGGTLAIEDFTHCDARWMEPISTDYRGYEVVVPPPNSYGLALLMQLMALSSEHFPSVPLVSAARFARLIAATRTAFSVAEPYIADPDFAAPIAAALSPASFAEVQRKYRESRAPMPPLPTGGTATLSIMDAKGNGITVLQSVMQEFGSGLVDPETGILLNNRMSGFTHVPGRSNTVAPGKKPAHTLTPCMVRQGGSLRWLIGTPGGSGQTATLAQALNARIDMRATLADAVAAPRWSLGRAGRIMFEDTVPSDLVSELADAGCRGEQIFTHVPYFGSVEAIERTSVGMVAVADHRREASALALN